MGAVVGPKQRWRSRFSEWWRDMHWNVLGLVALLAFGLGVIGFAQWFTAEDVPDATLWDAAYRSLQLFTLESGSVEPPVPLALNVARFLAPMVAVYGAGAAVVALFGEELAHFRLRWTSGHAVVCGCGDRGLYIAEQLLAHGRRVAVVDSDEDAPLLDRARGAGAVVVIGDAADPKVLRRVRADRAAQVVAVCPEDGDNAEIAVGLGALADDAGRNPPVVVLAHIDDTELCELLRDSAGLDGGGRGVDLRFFNVPQGGARALLEEVPPVATRPDRVPHLVVVGLGKLGRSLVAEMAAWWSQHGPPGSPRPRVTMIDLAAETKSELLTIRHPGIEETLMLEPLSLPKNDPRFERGRYLFDVSTGALDVDAVYVCPDDDVHALVAALTVQRHTRGSGVPIAVRMTRQGGLASLLPEGNAGAFADLRAVGVLDRVCDPAVLFGP